MLLPPTVFLKEVILTLQKFSSLPYKVSIFFYSQNINRPKNLNSLLENTNKYSDKMAIVYITWVK